MNTNVQKCTLVVNEFLVLHVVHGNQGAPVEVVLAPSGRVFWSGYGGRCQRSSGRDGSHIQFDRKGCVGEALSGRIRVALPVPAPTLHRRRRGPGGRGVWGRPVVSRCPAGGPGHDEIPYRRGIVRRFATSRVAGGNRIRIESHEKFINGRQGCHPQREAHDALLPVTFLPGRARGCTRGPRWNPRPRRSLHPGRRW